MDDRNRRSTALMRTGLIATVLMLAMGVAGCYERAVTDEYTRPVPGGSWIYVETGNTDSPRQIMPDVQALLFANSAYAQTMLSHGYSSPTGYALHFNGTCESQPEFVAAIRAEITKSTSAPVTCSEKMDTP